MATPKPATKPATGFRVMRLSDLKPGTVLSGPIFEDRADRETLLLAKGLTLTERTLEQLADRGITTVKVDLDVFKNLAEGKKGPKRGRDRVRTSGEPAPALGGRTYTADAVAHEVSRSRGVIESPERMGEFGGALSVATRGATRLLRDIGRSGEVSGSLVGHVSAATLSQMTDDFDLFTRLGIGPEARGPRGVETRPRTLRAARLAMAAGTVAGLPRERVNAIGTGCLLADIGSTPEDRRLEMLPRKLKPLEFFELTKRPSRAADILDRAPELGGEVRAVAFQIRERWDGSGYPRGRKGSQIHLLARLAMVADVYAALTSPRPWRKPYEPHAALRILLNETRSGKFDPVSVRIVIETLSLFPLGTLVTLDDGAIGRVVSSNFSDYTRPVLTLYDRKHGVWVDEPIDLAGDDSREVVATFDGLEQALGESPEASAAELVEAADAL